MYHLAITGPIHPLCGGLDHTRGGLEALVIKDSKALIIKDSKIFMECEKFRLLQKKWFRNILYAG